jgi:hypothetical protein
MALLGLAVFTGELSLASGDKLTIEKLENAEYNLRYGKVKLTDGICPNGGEGLDSYVIELSDKIAFGDLNGDGVDDAAAIFRSDGVGRRVWAELVAIVNDNGTPRQAAVKMLGLNEGVESILIRSGQIVIELGRYAPNDARCCPSLRVTQKYKLDGENLVPVP